MNVAILFAIGAALLIGTYLFLVKRYFSHYPASVYAALTNAFALAWYLPVAALTLDARPIPHGFGSLGAAVFAVTVGFTILGILTFFWALQSGAVSYVAPISKIIPVFVLPLEVVLLEQHLTPLQVAGVVIVTAAVYVANYRPGELLEPFRRAVTSRAAALALASAAAFGVVDVGKRTLMQELSLPPQTYVVALFAAVIVVFGPLAARQRPDDLRSTLPVFAVAGLLVAAGNHLIMLSLQDLPASIASPIVNTQAVFAVVLGGVVLGEQYFRIRLVAAVLAVAGVAVLALG
ncbi:MAG: EamA family transporter [Haloarculaceae archaeon]